MNSQILHWQIYEFFYDGCYFVYNAHKELYLFSTSWRKLISNLEFKRFSICNKKCTIIYWFTLIIGIYTYEVGTITMVETLVESTSSLLLQIPKCLSNLKYKQNFNTRNVGPFSFQVSHPPLICH